ncbi:hypothetical protein M8J76_005713 [Diaphorina citri]|nr:hypothetical protein M8J75_003308 [Diaphorina citri]KAI5744833.1 hypothetical protein M8J76_005713 [Diaphorina citri]
MHSLSRKSSLLALLCIVGNVCAVEATDKKFNHAYVLQDLETYQTSAPESTRSPSNPSQVYYPQPSSTPAPDYNNNPYLPRPQPPRVTSTPPPQNTAAPVQPAPIPPVVQPTPAPVTYPQTPVKTNGPHIYSAQATQYSGPQQTWADLQSSPVVILVKNQHSLSYDMAYASSGLSNLDRDTNSQLIAKLLLQNNDKVGILYPTNAFPVNSFPDFPVGNLILPQDMSLSKIFNFYPRYIPTLYLYSITGYNKVARETNLAHLGQYKYE